MPEKTSSEDARLILVLGDQLSQNLASLRQARKTKDIILMAEVNEEATYVRHHKKSIAFIFSAMRHFAKALKDDGWQHVDYVPIAESKSGSLLGEVKAALERHSFGEVVIVEPGEMRLLNSMHQWQHELGKAVTLLPDDRFLSSVDEFKRWAEGRKELRMEHFYRVMRRKTGLLMDGDQPEGGKWNYDHDNRKPAGDEMQFPPQPRFEPDDITCDVLSEVRQRFDNHVGSLEPFWFAVTREQALECLDDFIAKRLPNFGDYQDAMLVGERFMNHSILSLYINAGLLDPLEVCERAAQAYYDGDAPINAAEGFIRQVIGWREYIRGIYWLEMPGYVEQNYFGADRDLPDFYWTGETDMTCLSEAIEQTLEEAYAHHIQRLMITGNFAMLIGTDPKKIHEWYLAVYADAFEWVELPNTLGMSQFADGGRMSSKPYASGGNYINKMSNYCKNCRYSVSKKTGEEACPFNYLYWDFLARNEDKLKGNHRIARIYSTWHRMTDEKKAAYRESAAAFLSTL
ncbi:MAG: cryptochrome/photolyase family protein [Pseudomonadota bacterium]